MKKITDSPFKTGDIVCVRELTNEAVNWFVGHIKSVTWVPIYETPKEIDEKGNWQKGTASVTLYTEPVLMAFITRRGDPDFHEALWSELYPSTLALRPG